MTAIRDSGARAIAEFLKNGRSLKEIVLDVR